MTLLEDARKIHNAQPGCKRQPNGEHADWCSQQAMMRILAALELAEKCGITFEVQSDGVHLISNPRQRDLISERSARVMEAAERWVRAKRRLTEERITCGNTLMPNMGLSTTQDTVREAEAYLDAEKALVVALKGEGATV